MRQRHLLKLKWDETTATTWVQATWQHAFASTRKRIAVAWSPDQAPNLWVRCAVPFSDPVMTQWADFEAHTFVPQGNMTPAVRSIVAPDVMVLLRPGSVDYRGLIFGLQRNGTLCVVDQDDDFLNIPESPWGLVLTSPSFCADLAAAVWQRRDADPVKAFQAAHPYLADDNIEDVYGRVHWCASEEEARAKVEDLEVQLWRHLDPIRDADLLTVPTEALRERYATYAEHIRILPNAIALTAVAYRPRNRQRPHEGIILGWFGTGTHANDLRMIVPALRSILETFDGRNGKPWVRLMVGGPDEDVLEEALGDLPGIAALCAEIRGRPISFPPILPRVRTVGTPCRRYLYRYPIEPYLVPAVYGDVDIGLVPNVLNAFNDAKSDLKGLEMAGMGVPCIASPIAEYRTWRGKRGAGAIVLSDNDPQSWEDAMRRLIEDEALRRQMADEALAFAQTRDISVWAPKWMEVYEEAAQRRGKARTA